MSSVSLIDGHIDPSPLYIVYDITGGNNPPNMGVFSSYAKAIEAVDTLVNHFVNRALEFSPKESGLTEADRNWLIKDTRKCFSIQTLNNGVDVIHYNSITKSPYV